MQPPVPGCSVSSAGKLVWHDFGRDVSAADDLPEEILGLRIDPGNFRTTVELDPDVNIEFLTGWSACWSGPGESVRLRISSGGGGWEFELRWGGPAGPSCRRSCPDGSLPFSRAVPEDLAACLSRFRDCGMAEKTEGIFEEMLSGRADTGAARRPLGRTAEKDQEAG